MTINKYQYKLTCACKRYRPNIIRISYFLHENTSNWIDVTKKREPHIKVLSIYNRLLKRRWDCTKCKEEVTAIYVGEYEEPNRARSGIF